ncbi:MAG TPA: hypothetical protein ENO23_05895 [Alphaproteobacteria bacterium]|nr:hypothetical protein [Alphaproteobacteria bacterium]
MQRVALALSLLLHLLVLVAWRPIGRLTAVTAAEERAEESPPLVFELVETPENALRERPEEARFLSDKDAVARDERDAPKRPFVRPRLERRAKLPKVTSGVAGTWNP